MTQCLNIKMVIMQETDTDCSPQLNKLNRVHVNKVQHNMQLSHCTFRQSVTCTAPDVTLLRLAIRTVLSH